jgi:hypothetical protein
MFSPSMMWMNIPENIRNWISKYILKWDINGKYVTKFDMNLILMLFIRMEEELMFDHVKISSGNRE